jgi:protoporphyrinogen IX oxidase
VNVQDGPGDRRRIMVRAAVGLAVPLLLAGVIAIIAPVEAYLWLKAFHLVVVIGWIAGMAGILYLFAWHARTDAGSAPAAILTAIEQRAIRLVVNPGMVIAWGVGLWLAWKGEWFSSGWLQAKLVLVMILSGVHGWLVRTARNLAAGGARGGELRFSLGVEFVSVVLAVAAILLAVVKPM